MPNIAWRPPFTKRGQNWLPPSKVVQPPLATIEGAGGVVMGGAATVTVFTHTQVAEIVGSGGVLVGGAATLAAAHRVAAITGAGGALVGGSGSPAFRHTPPVASDVTIEWDFDNDLDFDEDVEDITTKVMALETFSGRDWPSQLTGTAGPGRFRAILNNEDDRFNYFQSNSPLNQGAFSLNTGRKLRVRTSDAASPDPLLIALDRFRRADSTSLGSADPGGSWTQPLADDFEIISQHAVATDEGEPHLAYLDLGAADYYLQVLIAGLGSLTNQVGICYRYVDSNDYSLAVIDCAAQAVRVLNIVAGVESVVASVPAEIYSGVTLGVLLDEDEVTVYVEGIPLTTATAINTSSELAGIYAVWGTGDTAPVIDNIFAWNGLGTTQEGILWTGDVSDVAPSVIPGPVKVANLIGEGWLSKMAAQDVAPPTSVPGRRTGRLLGAVLAECGLIHPPGPLDLGEVTTGPFAMQPTTALRVARAIEEAEFGFMYELPEGPIAFDSRTARDGSTALVTFSDQPEAQFAYGSISPMDRKREIFNLVSAGVSPYALGEGAVLYTDPGPYILAPGESVQLAASYSGTDGIVTRWTGHTRGVSAPAAPSGITVTQHSQNTNLNGEQPFTITLPTTATGDLLLIIMAPGDWDENVPSGWDLLSPDGLGSYYKGLVFGRIAEGDEVNDEVDFQIERGTVAAQLYRITSWFGDFSGIALTPTVFTSGNPNPPLITPPWGAIPTLYLACGGMSLPSTNVTPTQSGIPSNYGDNVFTVGPAQANGGGNDRPWLTVSRRVAELTTENPGTYALNTGATSNGTMAWTIAIRGTTAPVPVTGDTPAGTNGVFTISYVDAIGGDFQSHTAIEVSGVLLTRGDDVTVQEEDVVSQERHRAKRTYRTSASLFASPADALTYTNLVLSRHANDRPIFSISFTANKSAAYRHQALSRRLGDRIHLVANYASGLGVEADFYIESIGHALSEGRKRWVVTWELSPA
ncbi:hypothetical protein Aph01nite_13040 [Acrocarpospora phusangensis]|uniref:Uncharacterized protein n=1 Tax=Acrocarpospora phusangensis TaxID=1070424 RepID=A0A919Q5Y1_9ACTN|nr:hypothetical protein [Acrocarpospora phusangensis]GIH22994.1 hypothetical protein Aph01nite_13040 [Acrocarpospora phusangensis]